MGARQYLFKPLALTVAFALSAPATAEIRLGGDARMGMVYGLGDAASETEKPRFRFSSRVRLRMEASAQTDGGTTFGLILELDRERPAPARR